MQKRGRFWGVIPTLKKLARSHGGSERGKNNQAARRVGRPIECQTLVVPSSQFGVSGGDLLDLQLNSF